MATRGLNKIMIIGNLGRDPEMRYTPAGKAVANFTVAVGRITRDPSGERAEETEWFRVVAWDRLAETCQEYLKKGAKVYIEGRLQTRKYTDREGVERTSVEVVANEMMMLDSRATRVEAGAAVGAGGDMDSGQDDLEDMPF
jgi:single-strand DNA-binding protein